MKNMVGDKNHLICQSMLHRLLIHAGQALWMQISQKELEYTSGVSTRPQEELVYTDGVSTRPQKELEHTSGVPTMATGASTLMVFHEQVFHFLILFSGTSPVF